MGLRQASIGNSLATWDTYIQLGVLMIQLKCIKEGSYTAEKGFIKSTIDNQNREPPKRYLFITKPLHLLNPIPGSPKPIYQDPRAGSIKSLLTMYFFLVCTVTLL